MFIIQLKFTYYATLIVNTCYAQSYAAELATVMYECIYM